MGHRRWALLEETSTRSASERYAHEQPRGPTPSSRCDQERYCSPDCVDPMEPWRLGGTAGRVPTGMAPRWADVVEPNGAARECDCGARPVFQGVRLTPACCAIWIRVPIVVPPGLNEFQAVSKSLSKVQPAPRLDHSRASSRASGQPRISASATANRTESHRSRGSSLRLFIASRHASTTSRLLDGTKSSNQCPRSIPAASSFSSACLATPFEQVGTRGYLVG